MRFYDAKGTLAKSAVLLEELRLPFLHCGLGVFLLSSGGTLAEQPIDGLTDCSVGAFTAAAFSAGGGK